MARVLYMDFLAKLTWDDEFSPVRGKDAVREATGTGAASREEYEASHGADYMRGICHQLWDEPQINWDGKVLGCCRNFWGDFGGNAFRDGVEASVNGEKMTYAREMLQGREAARDDIPCTTCDIYLTMRERGRWLERGPQHREILSGRSARPREQALCTRTAGRCRRHLPIGSHPQSGSRRRVDSSRRDHLGARRSRWRRWPFKPCSGDAPRRSGSHASARASAQAVGPPRAVAMFHVEP